MVCPPSRWVCISRKDVEVETSEAFDDYLTNDMATVAYLKVNGHTPQSIEFRNGECLWRFYMIGDFLERLEDFQSGTALVNPQQYNRCFAQVKRDMYRVLDSQ